MSVLAVLGLLCTPLEPQHHSKNCNINSALPLTKWLQLQKLSSYLIFNKAFNPMDFSASITTPYQTVSSVTQTSSQGSSAQTLNQMRNGGILLLLLVVSYLCLRRWYQKQCKQQVVGQHCCEQQSVDQHRQQIESLERIWQMQSSQKLENNTRQG